jgi:malate dehydrogenase
MYLAGRNICDVVLVDIIEDMPAGKALDLSQAGPLVGYDTFVKGTNDFADIKDSDMVIVTSGLARKPGMSREDLLKANANIIKSVTENIAKYAPNSYILMVANPLDLMTFHAAAISKFPKNRATSRLWFWAVMAIPWFPCRSLPLWAEYRLPN